MEIEKRVRARAKRQKIQDAVVLSVYTTTAITMAVLAPNASQLLKLVEKYIGRDKPLDRRLSQAISRLCERGLLKRIRTEKGSGFQLTQKGHALAVKLEERKKIQPRKPKHWDGKWRIVIFDVWEKRRSVRDRLRGMLQSTGFVRIQNSVWVYPYDCEELFVFLRADLHLGRGVLYIVAEEVEHDRMLREHFNLPARQ